MRLSYEVFHSDVAAAVRFYVEVLGFSALEAADPADYVVVTHGEVRVGCCHHPDADPTHRPPPVGSEIVLRVADIRAAHDRVVAQGWPLADPLQARPWGLSDFRVFDPTGQYLRITEVAGTMEV